MVPADLPSIRSSLTSSIRSARDSLLSGAAAAASMREVCTADDTIAFWCGQKRHRVSQLMHLISAGMTNRTLGSLLDPPLFVLQRQKTMRRCLEDETNVSSMESHRRQPVHSPILLHTPIHVAHLTNPCFAHLTYSCCAYVDRRQLHTTLPKQGQWRKRKLGLARCRPRRSRITMDGETWGSTYAYPLTTMAT